MSEAPRGSVEGSGDNFDRLWTPHRMSYIKGESDSASESVAEGCPFCRAPSLDEVEGLVVAHGKTVYVVLNRYPYNSGHLLVCPYRHVSEYTDLDEDETIELARYTQRCITALHAAFSPQGFNVGMNLGSVAGAGIAAHLHQHIVPRWGGDTNFMPVIGQTKVLPQLLEQSQELLWHHWPQD